MAATSSAASQEFEALSPRAVDIAAIEDAISQGAGQAVNALMMQAHQRVHARDVLLLRRRIFLVMNHHCKLRRPLASFDWAGALGEFKQLARTNPPKVKSLIRIIINGKSEVDPMDRAAMHRELQEPWSRAVSVEERTVRLCMYSYAIEGLHVCNDIIGCRDFTPESLSQSCDLGLTGSEQELEIEDDDDAEDPLDEVDADDEGGEDAEREHRGSEDAEVRTSSARSADQYNWMEIAKLPELNIAGVEQEEVRSNTRRFAQTHYISLYLWVPQLEVRVKDWYIPMLQFFNSNSEMFPDFVKRFILVLPNCNETQSPFTAKRINDYEKEWVRKLREWLHLDKSTVIRSQQTDARVYDVDDYGQKLLRNGKPWLPRLLMHINRQLESCDDIAALEAFAPFVVPERANRNPQQAEMNRSLISRTFSRLFSTGGHEVPRSQAVTMLITFLEENPRLFDYEGLFRLTGNSRVSTSVCRKINSARGVQAMEKYIASLDLKDAGDVCTACNVLSKAMATFTYRPSGDLVAKLKQAISAKDRPAMAQCCRELLACGNDIQKRVWSQFLHLMTRIVRRSHVNKMTSQNVATVIMPNILRVGDDPEAAGLDMHEDDRWLQMYGHALASVLIENYKEIFPQK